MATQRFHKAARDSNLPVLKEASRKDCNAKDVDGMTPIMWAAFEGQVDALRLLVARGGEPDKSDNVGNTALHYAAERGHLNCVTFLVNFGANMWALNIEMHTPKELAAISGKDDVLRFLDEASANMETKNGKETKALKDKAQKEVEKKLKEYEKIKKKAEKDAEKEQKRLVKEGQSHILPLSRPSNVLNALKNKTLGPSSVRGTGASPRFSEIVGTVSVAHGRKLGMGSVQKKVLSKMTAQKQADDFKVVEVEDGRKSVRNLTGLRRDSEVLYVGKYENDAKRGQLQGMFDLEDNADALTELENEAEEDDDVLLQEPASIFDRPGFGSFAFRKSVTNTLSALPAADEEDEEDVGRDDVSLGDNESDEDLSDDYDDTDKWSPLQRFLVSNGLAEYIDRFLKEAIDLDALLLLTDEDLNTLGLPLGPRRKLTQAIANRRKALTSPPQRIHDSQL